MAVQVQEVSADYTDMISEAEYQEFLRYDGSDQDNVLPIMLESAIRQAEQYCNASFGNKEYIALFDNAEGGRRYYLPFGKIRAVNTVYSIDSDNVATEITTGFTVYGLDRKYIVFISAGMYRVEYTAGNATPSDVDKAVKAAILQILSESWERRDEVLVGESLAMIPRPAATKLSPYRLNIL